ncbi:MAG TPA: hypothetical protein VFN35_21710 [Ktedonobacteraceae bacterium]|nr:hypothetical protein [Ktedonobacteraceae bacterium]
MEDPSWGYITGDEEDYFWRKLVDDACGKDMLPTTYLEMHNRCYEAYNANPLAFAIIEMTTSFVLGKGVKVEARSGKVQKLLDAFWHDPANHMESRIYDICTELALYGEIFLRFFVNRFDGTVKLRMIDPSLIDEIETDPEDIETPLRFHQRAMERQQSTNVPVQPDLGRSSFSSEGRWLEAGTEVIAFAINKVSNARRGKSDLATLLPWLRRYKDWLTDRVRINKYKGAFLWDVTLKGADARTIRTKKMEYTYPPEPGSVVIHNEAEEWQAVRPEINANDAKEDGRALKLMIGAGASIPEHYLSDGDNGNRATAQQMSLPTFLKFQRRQNIIRHILRTILDRVLGEAQKAGRLSKHLDIARAYDLLFPEFDSEHTQEIGSSVASLMQGLSTARAQGWISNETAMQLLFQFCGIEIDTREERARIEQEQRF